MKFKHYEQDDQRWSRVENHKWCTDVPNCFAQVLYTYKDEINGIDEIESAIETGTYIGETTEIFSELFSTVHTVEKFATENSYSGKNLIEGYKLLKEAHPNINFYLGDSHPFIRETLTKYPDTRFVIFLDAHTPTHSPVFEELQAIKESSKRNDHVILVDDCSDLGGPGWPTQDQFEASIREINSDYKIVYTPYGRKITVIYP